MIAYYQRLIDLLQAVADGGAVLDELLEVAESLGVGRLGNPEPEVAPFGILLVQMVEGTLDVGLAVEGRVVLETVLEGAAQDGVGVYEAVGLCHNLAVDAARGMVGGGAMVLDRLCQGLYLLLAEPSAEALVATDDASRHEVVRRAVLLKPQIVVGGRGKDHVRLDVVVRGEGHALCHYRAGVVLLMRLVEGCIAGDDFRLDECPERVAHPQDDHLVVVVAEDEEGAAGLEAEGTVERAGSVVAGIDGEGDVEAQALSAGDALLQQQATDAFAAEGGHHGEAVEIVLAGDSLVLHAGKLDTEMLLDEFHGAEAQGAVVAAVVGRQHADQRTVCLGDEGVAPGVEHVLPHADVAGEGFDLLLRSIIVEHRHVESSGDEEGIVCRGRTEGECRIIHFSTISL